MHRQNLYLDTECDGVSESRERFGRVQSLQCWINHLIQRVDVVQLGSSPPD
jgi:hypothetical protein